MFTLSVLWMEHLNGRSGDAGGGPQLKARKDPNIKVLKKRNGMTLQKNWIGNGLMILKSFSFLSGHFFYFLSRRKKFL